MTIGVGQESVGVLKKRSDSLFCGVSKAIFTAIKSREEAIDTPNDASTSKEGQVAEEMEVDEHQQGEHI